MNPHFIEQTTLAGGEQLFVISKIPPVVNNSLTLMGIQVQGTDTQTVEVTGCLNVDCDNQWASSGSLTTNSDLSTLSYGQWLRVNDTAFKTVILADRQGVSFSHTQMLGLFHMLVQGELLHGKLLPSQQKMCQTWSQYVACASTDPPSWAPAPLTNYETQCGVVPLLREFQARGTSCLANFTTVLNYFLCKEVGRCFSMSGDSDLLSAYVESVAEFVASHLAVFVHDKVFLEERDGLVTTRNQSEFALGYYVQNDSSASVFVHGVLTDPWTGSREMASPVWRMATCLEGRNIDNNMAVRGKQCQAGTYRCNVYRINNY